MSESTVTQSRTALNMADHPVVEPERCAVCQDRAAWIRRVELLARTNSFIKPLRRWCPRDSRLREGAETCACGYSVLRGYIPVQSE